MILADTPTDRYIQLKNNPWLFIITCCFSLDQVAKGDSIKLMPDKEYLELYCRAWEKYSKIAVPKSRRMTMSWINICLYLHDTIFNHGRLNAFVSKKEEDANELIKKAKFIYDHIPENILSKEFLPECEDKFCVLDFPSIHSKLQGFPQGADQLRQFTFSGILGDECAFWESAQEFYSASLPTIDGGGRMTLISSPYPGFFKRLCFDALDSKEDINVLDYVPAYKEPLEGIKIWQNKKNKFLIFSL